MKIKINVPIITLQCLIVDGQHVLRNEPQHAYMIHEPNTFGGNQALTTTQSYEVMDIKCNQNNLAYHKTLKLNHGEYIPNTHTKHGDYQIYQPWKVHTKHIIVFVFIHCFWPSSYII